MIAMVEKSWADETGAIGDGLIAGVDGLGTRLNRKITSIDHSPKYDERRA
jgi:hypothetical protein